MTVSRISNNKNAYVDYIKRNIFTIYIDCIYVYNICEELFGYINKQTNKYASMYVMLVSIVCVYNNAKVR